MTDHATIARVREAVALIDEINERKPSRAFYGIGQSLHAKLCTIRATLARSLAETATIPAAKGEAGADVPHIFLDCDGVLADFDTYAEAYFGMPPRQYEKQVGSGRFWKELEAKGDFYRNLPLMPDARDLVEGVRHLNPTILTGCPRGNWAEAQKIAWAHEHFPDIPVITCRSADKRLHAKPGDVLIDDWPQHRHRWIEMGGVFISHADAATSLAALWAHYPRLLPTPPVTL